MREKRTHRRQNPVMGDYYAAIPSVDGKWVVSISLNSLTCEGDDGNVNGPDYAPIATSFQEQ